MHPHATDIIADVFSRFSTLRDREKVKAWMQLQKDLAKSAGDLVPHITSLKDMIAALADIEAMLKGQQGEAGESPTEYVAKFLNGHPDKVVTQ